jgi:cytosine/adenosine deaminase-related metal-dependent hydrolase
MIDQGLHVCLGADGAPCTNNLDIFLEMRLAALLHKPRVGPLAMSAMRVLEMATLEGARALGMEGELGSLEVGKRADVTVVKLDQAHATPVGEDPVAALVYSGKGSDVRHVVVDGHVLMRERRLLTLDEDEVLARARKHSERIARAVDQKPTRKRRSA